MVGIGFTFILLKGDIQDWLNFNPSELPPLILAIVGSFYPGDAFGDDADNALLAELKLQYEF